MDKAELQLAAAIGKASYFMIMGIDVAVRTAEVAGHETFSVAEQIIPPGLGFPTHSLKSHTFIIGLGGSVSLTVGEHTLEVDDSRTAFVPAGNFFAYRNDGNDEARILVITAAAGHDRFLRALSLNPQTFETTAARHDVGVVRGQSLALNGSAAW